MRYFYSSFYIEYTNLHLFTVIHLLNQIVFQDGIELSVASESPRDMFQKARHGSSTCAHRSS